MEMQQVQQSVRSYTQPVTNMAQGLVEKVNLESLPDVSLASVLGLVSLALGGTEVAFAREVARKSGLDPKYIPIVRAFGVREIVSGVGLLSGKNRKAWLWSRVVGDVLDSALLGYAYYNERQPDRRKKMKKAFAAISPIVAADVVSVLR